MEKANVTVRIGTCSVLKLDITPAEALFYMVEHRTLAKGVPIEKIEVTGETKDTPSQVMKKLSAKFGPKVKALFPGPFPNLPQKFSDLKEADVENVQMPESKNITGVEVGPADIRKAGSPPPDMDDQ